MGFQKHDVSGFLAGFSSVACGSPRFPWVPCVSGPQKHRDAKKLRNPTKKSLGTPAKRMGTCERTGKRKEAVGATAFILGKAVRDTRGLCKFILWFLACLALRRVT